MTYAPFFEWNGINGLPEFDKIDRKNFEAAFEIALEENRAAVDSIAQNPEEPTFENVIIALEENGARGKLSKVCALFWNLAAACTDETLKELEGRIAPKLSRHQSDIVADPLLFARIKAVWESRETLNLTAEQTEVLERWWKHFVRSGANLDEAKKNALKDVKAELAEKCARFAQNVLADESERVVYLEEAECENLPEFLKDAMREITKMKGEKGKEHLYGVTSGRSIIEPFLSFCPHPHLRRAAFEEWRSRGCHDGKTDNRTLVKEIVQLRARMADLLGYDNFALYKLEDQMAKNPESAQELLEKIWEKANAKARLEEKVLKKLKSAESGKPEEIEPWDWLFYAEKIRREKFALNEEEIKPYFTLEKMIEAAFDVAERLFGLSFRELEAPLYHEDARLFEILDRNGAHKALFIGDYFARANKRSGAWMSEFRSQHKLGGPADGARSPIIVNVLTLAKASRGPTLLSLDDAKTLFHEFGHALHGILSDVTFPSIAGTHVSRDFVELPSQLFEHWLTVPEILEKHARHCETGEKMPLELRQRLIDSKVHNAGFDAAEITSSALIDLAVHRADAGAIEDIMAFEGAVMEKLDMPKGIIPRHRLPHFAHLFAGDGYAAGYYSYQWAQVLDADAFMAFEEKQNPFDAEIAEKLHDCILSVGGSVKPEKAYVNFRGKMPGMEAMLRNHGLI